MVNNSKCECPFLPAHPWKSIPLHITISGSSSSISPGACRGGGPEGSSGRSGTVDWLCLGPAQQRSCIASWGCSPSSRAPDLTIPPCGCHRMATGSMLCPHKIRTRFGSVSSLSQQVLGRELKHLTASRSSLVMDPCMPCEAAGRAWGWGCSTTEYFVLRWQPGIILPKPANFFERQCRKNHHATSSKLTLLGSLTLSICCWHCIEPDLCELLIKINFLSTEGQMPFGPCAR